MLAQLRNTVTLLFTLLTLHSSLSAYVKGFDKHSKIWERIASMQMNADVLA